MSFLFKWVREETWRREPGQVMVLEMNPERIQPALSVQPQWNRSLGILRGVKENGFLLEAHIREVLTESGQVVDTGRQIVGADEMRAQVWTVAQHTAAYRTAHPEDGIVAWVGNGNLLSNPHFVGFVGEQSGVLYHLASEAAYLSGPPQGRAYSCLVVRRAGFTPRVNIETLFFTYQEDQPQVLAADGQPMTDQIEYATFGQRLVERGIPLDQERLIQLARDQQFYDLRGVFLFGRIDCGEKRWIDVGLAGFWDDHGHMDAQAVEDALHGRPISVRVTPFAAQNVHKAMADKGYDLVANATRAGEYSLKGDLLNVVLLEGIYQHNMIGIRPDGRVISVVLRGLSNRVGVTLRGAAAIMKMLGAHDALLIDSGGDVMMSFDGNMVLGSAEGERDRLRSTLLFRRAHDVATLDSDDLRLVIYPKQYSHPRICAQDPFLQ
jgi:hypothetical protein